MNSRKNSFSPPTGQVGGGLLRVALPAFLVLASVLATGSIALLLISPKSQEQAESPDSSDSENLSSNSWSFWPNESGESDEGEKTDLWEHISRMKTPTVKEVIERLHAMGDYSGIGAFNPPGTRPPLVGIAVPRDYVLPKGFVRHHQVTDDGQRIEAVLMFAPDYDHRDTYNRKVTIPEDRIVPPELAPLDIPIRNIVIPKPIEDR